MCSIGWFSGAFGPGTGAWAAYNSIGEGAARSIMEMDLVEWGNAQGDPTSGAFTCQHGPVECFSMKYQNCAKGLYNNDQYLRFVDCFDNTLIKTFPAGLPPNTVNQSFATRTMQACAGANNLAFSDIEKCAAKGGAWIKYVNAAKEGT